MSILVLIISGGLFLGMMYVSTSRSIVLFNKIFITNELRVRKGAGYFLSVLGLLAYLIILCIALATWFFCFNITTFIGKDTSSSGPALLIIAIAVTYIAPIIWAFSEFFIKIGYIRKE
ncbi:MAG: hypothetical protein GQ532_16650 [Methylomarinum sp.]|nr:hypothetical protein [Methylomarinum sp.]